MEIRGQKMSNQISVVFFVYIDFIALILEKCQKHAFSVKNDSNWKQTKQNKAEK